MIDTEPVPTQLGSRIFHVIALEGSVRKAGNKVRATLQLIDARTQEHEWSQNYDRMLDDIFEIQTDIAMRVADIFKVSVLAMKKSS